MISNSQVKHIRSLQQKKFRTLFKQFVAEGDTLVRDLLASSFQTEMIVATDDWLNNNSKLLVNNKTNKISVKECELQKLSNLKAPNQVLGVFNIPETKFKPEDIKSQLSIILDDIKDPGNLGTIIRIADWFGIKNIVSSPETVDVYNSKVVQATMGSIARVNVFYLDLLDFFKNLQTKIKIYGTLLDGESVYEKTLDKNGIIVIGNESRGISKALLPFITDKLFIPSFPIGKNLSKAESLNASIATAIICSEFRRNQ